MIVEIIGGLLSNSLALLADAGHMFTDFVALTIAWSACRLGQKPPSRHYTFGLGRLPILTAFVNGLTLIALAIWIILEAIHRFQSPAPISALPMFFVAFTGLLVNIASFHILTHADRNNLNIRGAMLHVLGDMYGSIGAILAALIIWKTSWTPIDPILSVLIAALIIRSALSLLKDTVHILLEGTPTHLNPEDMAKDLLEQIDGLATIQTLHIWALTETDCVFMLRATVASGYNPQSLKSAIEERLKTRYALRRFAIDLSI